MTGSTLSIVNLYPAFMTFIPRGYLGLITKPDTVVTGAAGCFGRFSLPVIIRMTAGTVLNVIREYNLSVESKVTC